MHFIGRQAPRQGSDPRITFQIARLRTQHLYDRHPPQQGRQLGQHLAVIRHVSRQVPRRCDDGIGIVRGDHRQDLHHPILIDRAQHHHDFVGFYLTGAVGNGLVKQTQRVAYAATGGLRDERQRTVFERDTLSTQHRRQMLGQQTGRHAGQIELQAARQDGDRKFFRIGGREQKFDVGRRFFQGFQQCVKRVVGEHVHFVDQIDLITRMGGRILDVVEQFTGLINLGARRGIDFDQVNETTLIDGGAGTTRAAGRAANPRLAVQCLGQHARQRGLAYPARAGEQISVVQAPAIKGIDQGFEHMRLTDHFREVMWPPLACKDLIAHVALLITKTQGGCCGARSIVRLGCKAANVPATPRHPQ